MKILIILGAMVVFSILLLFILGKYSQNSHAPGVVNGSLSKCLGKPNCVCSEHSDDAEHYIEPIKHAQVIEANDMAKALATIKEMGGVIGSDAENYVAATFTSKIFGFVDDLEIRNDSIHGVMHVRSASRVGYGDGGVNRKRVELFKSLYGN